MPSEWAFRRVEQFHKLIDELNYCLNVKLNCVKSYLFSFDVCFLDGILLILVRGPKHFGTRVYIHLMLHIQVFHHMVDYRVVAIDGSCSKSLNVFKVMVCSSGCDAVTAGDYLV